MKRFPIIKLISILSSILILSFTTLADSFNGFTYSIVNNEYVRIYGYTGSNDTLEIPQTIDGYDVKEISSFFDSSIRSISFPYGLSTIRDNTFYGCKLLESVDLPNSLVSLGWFAFNGCSSLKHVYIPSTLKSISSWAFAECVTLNDVDISIGVSVISNGAFLGCKSLESIELPRTIEVIDESAFDNCKKLDKIVIPYNCKFLGKDSFARCSNLSSITILNHDAYVDDSMTDSTHSPQLVIRGFDGSTAEEYASSHNIKFESINGDANIDGEITVSDAVLMSRYIAEDSTVIADIKDQTTLDVDKDGYITILDVVATMNKM